MSRTTIVVPCYNEAQRLDVARFREYAEQQRGVQLLLVNDGSRDETLAVLERLRTSHPPVFDVHDLGNNQGKAEAVRQGMLLAWELGAEYAGFWDADLATPLEQIADFVRVLDRKPYIDAVFGSRIRLPGRVILRKEYRHRLGRLFNAVVSRLLGMPIYDTQCGAKLFRNTPENRAVFAQPFTVGWIFDVEILARLIASRRGWGLPAVSETVYEYPLDYWEDVAGSKLRSSDFLKAILETAGIWWRYLRPGLPIQPRPASTIFAPLVSSGETRRAA
jgi:glycosyltransferase involved in cell wall biosynthesis